MKTAFKETKFGNVLYFQVKNKAEFAEEKDSVKQILVDHTKEKHQIDYIIVLDDAKNILVKKDLRKRASVTKTTKIFGMSSSVKKSKGHSAKNFKDAQIIQEQDIKPKTGELIKIKGTIIEGETSEIIAKKTKKHYYKANYVLLDEDGVAFKASKFGITKEQYKQAPSVLGNGSTVYLFGNVTFDNYVKETVFNFDTLYKAEIKNTGIDDNSVENGRYELLTHTKMSQMESVADADKLLDRAAEIGLSGLAFTDDYSVQSYDVLMHSQNKYKNLRPLYGLQIDVVDERPKFVFNPNDIDLFATDTTYVAFDLETTGFSAIHDEIIQISAVRFKVVKKIEKKGKGKNAKEIEYYGVEEIDNYNQYVNPHRMLSEKIRDITHIEQYQVDDGIEIEQAIKEFDDYIGQTTNTVLVGHNVKYDTGYINERRNRLNIGDMKVEILDTLTLAHRVFQRSRGYNLTALTKRYKIKLDNAHNSLFDAQATGLVCFELLKDIREQIEDKYNETIVNGIDLQKFEPDDDAYTETMFSTKIDMLAKDQDGIKDIYDLVSVAHTQHFYYSPRLYYREIQKMRERNNILVGSGGKNSKLTDYLINKPYNLASKLAKLEKYDYIEISTPSALGLKVQENINDHEIYKDYIEKAMAIAKEIDAIPVVVGDVYYINKDDLIIYNILRKTNISESEYSEPEFYLKSADDLMNELAPYLTQEERRQIVIDNTQKIGKQLDVEHIEPIHEKLTPPRMEGADEEIRETAYKRAHELYGKDLPKLITDRIERELSAIIDNGFTVVYLTAKRLIDRSMSHDYLVGSRGSVGGSLVAFLVGITEVNALPPHYRSSHGDYVEFVDQKDWNSGFDLPDKEDPNHPGELLIGDGHGSSFEVFTGVSGKKVPDIDLNFASEIQSTAQTWMKDIFGSDHVFRVGAISTIAEKTAFSMTRDYAETNNLGYSKTEIEYLSTKLRGVKKTTGQHAAGIVTVPQGREITEFTPYTYPANKMDAEWLTTHFPKDILHDSLLKMDCLGHIDPSMLHRLYMQTGKNPQDITLKEIQDVVKKVFGQGRTAKGMPEFGTAFARQMIDDAKPKYFSDLVQLSGLSHGKEIWVGNAQDLIKQGHATLQTVIGTRDKIINDLMSRGISLSDAYDVVQVVKSGGKKPFTDEMAKMISDAGMPDWYVKSIRKITYVFPAAHAIAYVLSAVRLGYYKLHYPKEFYADWLTYHASSFDVQTLIKNDLNAIANRMNVAKKEIADRIDVAKNKELISSLDMSAEAIQRGTRYADISLDKSGSWTWEIDKETGVVYPPLTTIDGFGGGAADSFVNYRDSHDGKYPQTLKELKAVGVKMPKKIFELFVEKGLLSDVPAGELATEDK